jgi:hypothetical protein
MERIDGNEDDNVRRMQRYEWLCKVIQQATHDADANRRLEEELRRHLANEPRDHPPEPRAA